MFWPGRKRPSRSDVREVIAAARPSTSSGNGSAAIAGVAGAASVGSASSAAAVPAIAAAAAASARSRSSTARGGSASGNPIRSADPSKTSALAPSPSVGQAGAVGASPERNASRAAGSISWISSWRAPLEPAAEPLSSSWWTPLAPSSVSRSGVPFADAPAAAAVPRSASGQAPASSRTWSKPAAFGNGAGRISAPRFGAQVRQRPSAGFQQLLHVYCRQFMQKLKVEWNASSCWAVASRSSSPRAAAMASSSDESSLMTQFFTPFERVLNWPSFRVLRGATDSKV